MSGRFEIIYADPPWSYDDRGIRGSAEGHYKTMSLDDICKLPVNNLAADNCALFVWGTYPTLPNMFRVIEAWGFRYKTLAFQWVKLNRKNQEPFFGLGHWTRGNTEGCYLAVKGKPQRIDSAVSQIVMGDELVASPVGSHSAKPPEVRERIVKLMGDLPRIELFARERVAGWDGWGNEYPKEQHT
jgi:N6-adenosine-specific RNA methylase IME4